VVPQRGNSSININKLIYNKNKKFSITPKVEKNFKNYFKTSNLDPYSLKIKGISKVPKVSEVEKNFQSQVKISNFDSIFQKIRYGSKVPDRENSPEKISGGISFKTAKKNLKIKTHRCRSEVPQPHISINPIFDFEKIKIVPTTEIPQVLYLVGKLIKKKF